jgi:foldase protein PrsA
METFAAAQGLEMQTETFDSDSTSPAEEVVEAADALTTEGELAELVETDDGCYVIRLQSLLDREATDSKKEEIVTQRKTDQYNSLLEEWRSDANIKEYKNVLKKLKLKDQGVTLKQETEESSGSESTTQE